MEIITEVAKAYFIPGSPTFLYVGVFAGVVLLLVSSATRKWGVGLLVFIVVFYWILSVPAVAGLFERILMQGYEPIRSADQIDGVDTIVVLGGGSGTYRARGGEINELSAESSLRVLEGARLYWMIDDPQVVVSGGTNGLTGILTPESVPMQQELMLAGISPDRILLESHSSNTREQALQLSELLDSNGIQRFVLVTSPTHMRRAVSAMEAEGLSPIPSPSSQHSEGHVLTRGGILPHPEALQASHAAIREAFALSYYWAQGWIELP